MSPAKTAGSSFSGKITSRTAGRSFYHWDQTCPWNPAQTRQITRKLAPGDWPDGCSPFPVLSRRDPFRDRQTGAGGGKSELRRIRRLLTGGAPVCVLIDQAAGGSTESATENRLPPPPPGGGAKVKRWCKRPPVPGASRRAGKPRREQDRAALFPVRRSRHRWGQLMERGAGDPPESGSCRTQSG